MYLPGKKSIAKYFASYALWWPFYDVAFAPTNIPEHFAPRPVAAAMPPTRPVPHNRLRVDYLVFPGMDAEQQVEITHGLNRGNPDAPMHPASVTKLLLMASAFQAMQEGFLTPDTEIFVDRLARLGIARSTISGLHGHVRLDDLLGLMATRSYNDLAVALARHLSQIPMYKDQILEQGGTPGSEYSFSRAVLQKLAKETIGMETSDFWFVHGLPPYMTRRPGLPFNVSSAADLVRLAHYIDTRFPEFTGYLSVPVIDLPRRPPIYNTNHLLETAVGPAALPFPGVAWGKTGTIDASGSEATYSGTIDGEKFYLSVAGFDRGEERDAQAWAILHEARYRLQLRKAMATQEFPGSLPQP